MLPVYISRDRAKPSVGGLAWYIPYTDSGVCLLPVRMIWFSLQSSRTDHHLAIAENIVVCLMQEVACERHGGGVLSSEKKESTLCILQDPVNSPMQPITRDSTAGDDGPHVCFYLIQPKTLCFRKPVSFR
jgi:hypothetical protein